jgi:site-specific DNA recombinase
LPPATAVIEKRKPTVFEMEATAVIYLRVSSDGQVNKAHNPEGYSIPAQREACERHAANLGATVIGEFVEAGYSGTTLRRPALQAMLAQLPEAKPTYVIFYDLSRVAREESDAFWLLGEIKRCGAKLESTVERIDDSPQGLLLFAVMAGVNAFRSRGDAEKVKLGMSRKHADGGTVGKAPIGYLNTVERIEGREVRTIDLDPARAPLVRLGFDAYATGEYSISALRDLLDEAGLRTPMRPKRAPAPLSRANVHYMLRRDYYIGIVTWRGAKNVGRHPALIDEGTFKKVQEVLDAHARSGDRTHKHHHYLKGSIYCGHCGRRLIYSRVRGRSGGHYEYFGCASRPGRGEQCAGRHMKVEEVERAIERYFVGVRLTKTQRQAVRREVRRYADALAQNAEKEADRHARRLQELQRQQQKLLHLHYEGKVDEDVVAADQERIGRERAEASKWADAAKLDRHEVIQALDEALKLLSDTQLHYEHATPHVRRLINQAIFKNLLILGDWVSGAEETEWVVALRALAMSASRPETRQGAAKARKRGGHENSPAFGGCVSNENNLVRPAGFEPATSCSGGKHSIH